jgi:hypothetical protein
MAGAVVFIVATLGFDSYGLYLYIFDVTALGFDFYGLLPLVLTL